MQRYAHIYYTDLDPGRRRQRQRKNGVLFTCMDMPRHYDAIFTSSCPRSKFVYSHLVNTVYRLVSSAGGCFRKRRLLASVVVGAGGTFSGKALEVLLRLVNRAIPHSYLIESVL